MRPVSRSADEASGASPLIPATLGIRHHSPAGALAVQRMLETLRPACILLEAPVDAVDALLELAHPQTVLPVALLAFSTEPPGQRFSYPLSETSPEWIALRWAREHGVPVRGIDLPSGILLGLDAAQAHTQPDGRPHDDPHEVFARAAGAADFATWWERHVEHSVELAAQQRIVDAFARGLRERLAPDARAGLELREAHMRRRILEVLAEGHPAERCLLVCGALHAPHLDRSRAPMEDASLAALPQLEATLSPIAYGQPRLSSASGYGAGIPAPAYAEALGAQLRAGTPEALAPRFLAALAHRLREASQAVSSAEVIDALALSRALAALADSPVVTLGDLTEAARTCFGRVAPSALEAALAIEAVGARVGSPGGELGRSPLAVQLRQALHRLGLGRFVVDRRQALQLDLRPSSRGATHTSSAVGPLAQSRLLHRLHAADLGFCELIEATHAGGAWRERWMLRWSPDLELALIERSRLAETLEDAAAARLDLALTGARSVDAISALIAQAITGGLPGVLARATDALAARVLRERALGALVAAAEHLTQLLRRHPEHEAALAPLRDALQHEAVSRIAGLATAPADRHQRDGTRGDGAFEQLAQALTGLTRLAAHQATQDGQRAGTQRGTGLGAFVAAAEVQPLHETGPAASASTEPSSEVATRDASAGPDTVSARLDRALLLLATGLDGCARTRGMGCGLALRRGLATGVALDALLSRWLSRGVPPIRAASFLEGLLHPPRIAVLEHRELWRSLDAWVSAAPADALLHVLPAWRRALAPLPPAERRLLDAQLRRTWGAAAAPAAPPLSTSSLALARALEPLDALELEP